MLSFALLLHGGGRMAEAAVAALAGVLAPEDRLDVFVLPARTGGEADAGPGGIEALIRRRRPGAPGDIVHCDTGALSLAEAAALALRMSGADWVLPLGMQDRVHPPGLAALRKVLGSDAPDLVVLNDAFRLAAAIALPRPDAARFAALPERPGAEDLFALAPDPRRLLRRGAPLPDMPDPHDIPAAAWRIWDDALGAATAPALCRLPVLLRPWPARSGAAAALDAVAADVAAAPRRDRAARLDRALLRAGDALALAPAGTADEVLAAAARLRVALPYRLRRRAGAAPGPAGRLLAALGRRGGRAEAAAHLALLSAASREIQTAALAAAIADLRTDLDLALPRPDYLQELYTRIRGQ